MKTLCPLLLLALLSLDAAPTVTKVEPPNWWVGHSINPVRLLIRGAGLQSARVSSDNGIAIGPVKVNDAGTYLFADVTIRSAGAHPLKITTSDGTAIAPFEALAPLPHQGRFQGFSPDDVIYLIMPDRFANGDPSNDDPPVSKGMFDRAKARYYHGGDLAGIRDHLDYLKDLGATALWINPIYDNVNHLNEREKYNGEAITDYHGYGAVDFYSVDEHLGDVAKFRDLVDAAHSRGIKVILDMVANHTGPYHPWVQDSPTPTWFHGTAAKHLNETWQTWTLADPHAADALRKPVLDGWFIDILPDLNQEDPEVARYLIQNTLWWVGVSGLDGIRQDTLPYVSRRFWHAWMAAIKKEFPGLRVVGEMFDGDPALVSFFQGGRKQYDGIDSGVDSLFDFPSYFVARKVFAQGAPIKDLAVMAAHDWLYPNPDVLVTFLGLHDVKRFMNESGAAAGGLKLAFTWLLTGRGTPMIYYGDEIAMRGGDDPDNRRDFPGGWREDPRNAFIPAGRTVEEQSVFEHVRKLARLRAEIPDLRRGRMTEIRADDNVYVYRRGDALVMLNNGPKSAAIEVAENGAWKDALGTLGVVSTEGGLLKVTLPARGGAVMIRR
ncbi:MAG: alpha-amylase family glycosyl hydrolase [Acidobacteriota bacterium]|nr:alpha-amylase family glycosyl hydrolase [Acidobacteriota bacterium]